MREWKTIETRTHGRFACLKGKRILIHAGQRTDEGAINNPYLTRDQLLFNPDEVVNGVILGSAFVSDFRMLDSGNSKAALIECASTTRYGLFLKNIDRWEVPIPVKGEMGIWYYDTISRVKVKKQAPSAQQALF